MYVIREGQPWYFMEEWFPGYGALMPRDVVSQSIYKVCNEMKLGINGSQEVYLDVSHLSPEIIDVQLDEVVSICSKFLKVNPYKEPIPVAPGIHYFMGESRRIRITQRIWRDFLPQENAPLNIMGQTDWAEIRY